MELVKIDRRKNMKDMKMHFNPNKYSLTKDLYPFMTKTLFPQAKTKFLDYLKAGINLTQVEIEIVPLHLVNNYFPNSVSWEILVLARMNNGDDIILASSEYPIKGVHKRSVNMLNNRQRNNNVNVYINAVLDNYCSYLKRDLNKIRVAYRQFSQSKFNSSELIELINDDNNFNLIEQNFSDLSDVKIKVSDNSFVCRDESDTKDIEYTISLDCVKHKLISIKIDYAELFESQIEEQDCETLSNCLYESMMSLRWYLKETSFIKKYRKE